MKRRLQVATIVAKNRTGFYFVQRCAQQQQKMRCKLPRYPVTPRNYSATCNATQVAVKIARCNLNRRSSGTAMGVVKMELRHGG